MEEIIASISRIISEDKRPGDRRAAEKRQSTAISTAPDEKDEVLELTQAVNEDGSVRQVTTRGPSQPKAAEQTHATSSDTTARVEPELLRAEPTADPRPGPRRERILSNTTSGAAAAAFAQLGALPRESRRQGELPLGGGDRTLDEIVRDMLRPLLQAWLDEHLPGMVERLVREEIARVVGEAGLR
ncbi:MAG: DUF2497 domain-containing protein [Alphaproteobacteria bacterium]|nr:DUF2497 domain-containing protein [Alphaproteobacteria bacterium]MBV8335036.1 DUF2497 domain-containing protein [Alphaproteobacteria bacterium]